MQRETSRHRWLAGLAVVAIAAIIILGAWQARARRSGARTPVERALMTILEPSIRAAGAIHNGLTPPVGGDAEPEAVASYLRRLEDENRQLRALLGLRDRLPAGAIAAEIFGRGTDPWQGFLILGKGSADGVEPRMVALTPEGVLGQVVTVTGPHTAEVLPLTDRASGIGAMSDRGETPGVLKGAGNGLCELIYLPSTADVRVGDLVVTSGLGFVFPRGFPLGTVTRVRTDPATASLVAAVRPAADPARAEMAVLLK